MSDGSCLGALCNCTGHRHPQVESGAAPGQTWGGSAGYWGKLLPTKGVQGWSPQSSPALGGCPGPVHVALGDGQCWVGWLGGMGSEPKPKQFWDSWRGKWGFDRAAELRLCRCTWGRLSRGPA